MTNRAAQFVVLVVVTFLCGCASRRHDREPVHLWPLFDQEFSQDQESLEVMWPLYSHEIKGDDYFKLRQVPLFTWQRRGDYRELDVLWPIFEVEYGGDKHGLRIAPVYFHGRSTNSAYDVVFPVYWSRRGEHFHIWPLYYWEKDGGHGTLWPLIGVSSNQTRFLPFYHSRQTEEESTRFVFPYGTRTAGEARTRWVVPLYLDHHAPNDHMHLLIPFWFQGENPSGDPRTRIFFPFYWELRNQDDATTVVVPFYGRRQSAAGRNAHFIAPPLYIFDRQETVDRTTHHLLWPLFARGTGPDYTLNRLFPFEYAHEADALPEDTDGQARARRSHFRLYPLFYSHKRLTEYGQTVRRHVLFPLWWYKDDQVSQRSHNVIFPFSWHYRSGDKATDALFPLFYVNKDVSRDEDYYAFLWPLTWYRASPRASDFRFLWKLVEVSNDRERKRSHWALNPLFRVEKGADAKTRFDLLGGLFGVRVQEERTRLRFFYFINL